MCVCVYHKCEETTCRLCQNFVWFLATEHPFLPFYPLTSLSLGSTISSCRNFTRTKFFSLSKLFFWVAFLFWEMKMKSFTGISYLHFYQQNYLHKTTLKFKISLKVTEQQNFRQSRILKWWWSIFTFSWLRSARKTLFDLYSSSCSGSCQYSAWTRLQFIYMW